MMPYIDIFGSKMQSSMGRTLHGLIWSNIMKVQSLIGGGVVTAIMVYEIPPNTTISSNIVIPIIVILIIIVIALANSTYESFNFSQKILPSILYSGKHGQESLKCLLEPSELFSQNSLVSFYFRDDDDFERFVGIGKVEIIRENDNKIQIELTNFEPSYEEIIRRLENNDPNTRRRIQIKPNVPDRYLR